MRPVCRGDAPTNAAGTPRQYRHYGQAKWDLVDRIGEYCSYCEMRLPAELAVEHILPKGTNPDQELVWSNFLLACRSCNSIKKGSQDNGLTVDECLWPDRDNTFRALRYDTGGLVSCNVAAPAGLVQLAKNTIWMTGLDRVPGHPQLSPKDRRWMGRQTAWGCAELALANLRQSDTDEMRGQIVETAVARGHWSIWMTVFADDQDMLQRLIGAFPGTATDCFDDQCVAVARPNGKA